MPRQISDSLIMEKLTSTAYGVCGGVIVKAMVFKVKASLTPLTLSVTPMLNSQTESGSY